MAKDNTSYKMTVVKSKSRREFIKKVGQGLAIGIGSLTFLSMANIENPLCEGDDIDVSKIRKYLKGKLSDSEIEEFINEYKRCNKNNKDSTANSGCDCHCSCSCKCGGACDCECMCGCTCDCECNCTCLCMCPGCYSCLPGESQSLLVTQTSVQYKVSVRTNQSTTNKGDAYTSAGVRDRDNSRGSGSVSAIVAEIDDKGSRGFDSLMDRDLIADFDMEIASASEPGKGGKRKNNDIWKKLRDDVLNDEV